MMLFAIGIIVGLITGASICFFPFIGYVEIRSRLFEREQQGLTMKLVENRLNEIMREVDRKLEERK